MENISSKEIIEDINKMKDIRRKVLAVKYDDKIKRDKTGVKIFNIFKSFSLLTGILGTLSFLATGFIPGALFVIITFSLMVKVYNDFENMMKKKLVIDTNLDKRNVSDIDELIDNYELILDNRKDRDIDKSKIKNLNICFRLDERYNYDLKQINDKYKYIVSDEVNTNDYVDFDSYFKDIKLSVNDLSDEMMPTSKVKIKSIYKE